MDLAVWEEKETPESKLEHVVLLRPGWVKLDYKYRGAAFANMNVLAFVGNAKNTPSEPDRPPLKNYRLCLDNSKYAELFHNSEEVDAQTRAEMQAMPRGREPHLWFLEEFQLKECAYCGKCDGELNMCSGCRSFVYCSKEHQVAHWKKEHKAICLKRKQW